MRLVTDAVATFGVYIHWPFCAQKCPYCDFNSHVRFGGWDETRFLKAYLRELDSVAELLRGNPLPPCGGGLGWGGIPEDRSLASSHNFERHRVPPFRPPPRPSEAKLHLDGGRSVSSIFFGGGTPSLMKPQTVGAILDHIAKLWPIEEKAEITIEANPGSVEAARFKGYRDAGVNRVSMGLQSLRDDELKKLGRIHTVAESKAALEIARSTFQRFSFDLIYARPKQTPQDWRAELAEALDLAGDHISLYQLTIEPDTPYAALHASGKLIVPDADAALALYEITQEMTSSRGLNSYEISNHARTGQESQHNLLYWRYGEYAGIGPGAHGRLLVANHGAISQPVGQVVALQSPSPISPKASLRLDAGEGWGGGCPQTALSKDHPHPNPPSWRSQASLGRSRGRESREERSYVTTRIATVTEKNPEAWCALVEEHGAGFTEITALKPDEQADEMLLMGLRLREGIDLKRLAQLGGVAASPTELADLEQLGLIEVMRVSSPSPHFCTQWGEGHGGAVPSARGEGRPLAPAKAPSSGNWRANELEEIAMCASPGMAPEASASSAHHVINDEGSATHIRATPRGRFVLNAVVARLSKTFVTAEDLVALKTDQAPLP